jgi:tetratricopeptide (TPR) repeat protein
MAAERRRTKRRPASGGRYTSRSGAPGSGQGNTGRRLSRSERMRRRRKRLIRALAAWAVCILLMLLIAAGTMRLIGMAATSKKRQLRSQGIECLASGDYNGAIEAFDMALEKSGERAQDFNKDVLQYRAEAELKLLDYEAALHTYELLAQQEPKEPVWGYLRAICSARLNTPEEAFKLYEEASAMEKEGQETPGRLPALMAVGSAWTDAGEYQKAMAFYEGALEKGIEDAQIYNQMGICQMAEEDYEGAADSFDKGLGLLAAAYGTSRETAVLKAAIPAEDTWNLDALKELSYNRAVVLEYQQDYGKALSCFQEYVDAFGAEEDALHEIEFLKTR